MYRRQMEELGTCLRKRDDDIGLLLVPMLSLRWVSPSRIPLIVEALARLRSQSCISSIPDEHSPQALYTFTLGDDSNPLAPAYLTLVSRTRASFVNTSLHFLNGFDYLYDADGGFVGFRWTGHASRGLGKVVPASPSN
jgi:hypothetical protein